MIQNTHCRQDDDSGYFCSLITKAGAPALQRADKHGQHRDGKHGEGGAEENALGHQPFVLVELQTEHHSVDTDGHAAQHYRYLKGEGVDGGNEPEDDIYHCRNGDETHKTYHIGKTAAEHRTLGHGGQGAADDYQGHGNGHVAAKMKEPGHEGRCLHLGKGKDNGDERGNDTRTQHTLRLDGIAGLATGDEHLADGVHQQVEGDGEDGGIEEGTIAENGRRGGKSHEGDVAEGRHET